MKTTTVGKRTIMFTFDVSTEWDLNLALILGDRFNFIVDPGLGSHTLNPMLVYANENHPRPVIVINTHYHWDHTWANACVKDSVIIGHATCGTTISEHWEEALAQNASYLMHPVEKVLPDLTFEASLDFPGEGITLIYTPGHSIDSISIIDERDGIIHMGDNIGDTLDAIVPYLECDKSVYLESLKRCKDSGCHTVLSGHNQVLSIDIIDQIIDNVVVTV